ncbi:MAG TPA: S26 family signal peptidase [Tepidisphaeraceae bacterium]
MALATATMDVHPPRAGRMSMRLRRVRPVARTYYEARDAMGQAGARSVWLFGQIAPSVPPLPVTIRLILPGWSQFYVGRRVLGHLFLWSFLVLLLLGLLFFGRVWGSVLLGLAFSVHSSAALDIVAHDLAPGEVRRRMIRGLLVTAALALVLYLPAGRLLTAVADPQVIDMPVYPFLQEHDVLLVNHWTTPHVGQIVLYDLPEFTEADPGVGHHRTIVNYRGARIDRILAGPGDVVRWEEGLLLVNNLAGEWAPLNRLHPPGKATFKVPEGKYFILPSTTPGAHGRAESEMWRDLSMIPFTSIHGSAYLRSNPLTRWARLR